ncbi:MAG: helix-turn-helix domain containing protein [Dictyoglomi bacterium]|nr:helix-turn-helix domain containing protein [Dictyoglomota bacterium]
MRKEDTNCVFGEESYFERIRDSKNPVKIRLKIVEYLEECKSVSETARRFKVSRQIVRKWEKRFREEGMDGLRDRPKTPKSRRTVITEEIKKIILSLRREYNYGPRKIKRLLKEIYKIDISEHPIYDLLKTEGLIKDGNDHK